MEKRTLLAIVLSLMVFVGYTKIMQIFYPNYGKHPQSQSAVLPEGPGAGDAPAALIADERAPEAVMTQVPGAESAVPGSGPMKEPEAEVVKEELISLKAGSYEIGVSEIYGSIASIKFTAYEDPEGGGALKFLEASKGSYGLGAHELWVDDQYVRQTGVTTDVRGARITAAFEAPGLKGTKTLVVSKRGYGNNMEVEITNTSDQTKRVRLRLCAGSGVVVRNVIDNQYIESNWIRGEDVTHIKGLGKGKTKKASEPFEAASIKSRHFSSIIKPLGKTQYVPIVEGQGKKNMAVYLFGPDIVLAPGQSWRDDFLFYVGLNQVEELKPFGLDSVVNFGKLDPICKLLLGLMQMIYKGVRNYGLAIIVLTLFINILLTPLTKTSFLSMRRMQLVQPEITKLREKHKNDPNKLNKEMMELYKKHKVNPMGGCLPMMLQMPVFISLYVAVSKSPELLGANFLWVKDLAYPDVVNLPFALPLFGKVLHILPLVMVGAMIFQQKMSMSQMPQGDTNTAQQQKMMMIFMPIFFGFIFYPMPSGLVIYWLTNTIAMSAYQRLLKSQPLQAAPRTIR